MAETPWAVVDIETDPEDGDRILCVGVCWPDESAPEGFNSVVVTDNVEVDDIVDLQWVCELLANPEVVKVEHSKFDYVTLKRQGWWFAGDIHDTMVMAWLLNENQQLGLGSLIFTRLKYDADKRLRRSENRVWFVCDDGTEVPIGQAPLDQLMAYNGRDILGTARLYLHLLEELDEQLWLDHYLEELVPFTQVLADMELAGLPIDIQATEKLRDEVEVKATAAKAALYESAGLPPAFNIGSGDQLASYLFSFRMQVHGSIKLGVDGIACLKSCLEGEHEDCQEWVEPCDAQEEGDVDNMFHIRDLLPDGFFIEHVGREYVAGYWSVKGRNFPTKTDMGKVAKTDSGSRHKVDTMTLMVHFADDPWVRDLVAWRKLDKLLTTYLRKFPQIAREAGGGPTTKGFNTARAEGESAPASLRIYGRFNQTGTKTGRLSSSDPNLQNIPARGEMGERIRDLFRSDTGLIVADYSQLEPRLMAHFSQDPELLRIYREGLDIYNVTGQAIFGYPVEKGMVERDISKTSFLGTQYGAFPPRLAAILCINGFPTTVDRAQEILDELMRFYRVAYEWKDAVIERVHRDGYVRTIGGHHRRLRFQFSDAGNWKNVGYGERQAVNAIIQGSAGDIVRRSMVAFARSRLPELLRLLAQVHDELVLEMLRRLAREELDLVLTELRYVGEQGHGFSLDVPLVFEPHFGHSWASAKEGSEDVIEVPEEEDE
jgi:DNA polymerase I-like protein with 3'-5' exonuclease and polymerase domains